MKFIATPFCVEDIEKLKIAQVDAVIISLSSFSLRGTTYFEVAQMPTIMELCTSLDIEVFVQMNRFFYEQELEEVRACMKVLKQVGVDGIYFGDEGVLWIASQLDMVDKMIYAPDTLLTNSSDVNFYVKQGLHHVVLAKEITLDEILLIAQHSMPSHLEIQIHGRLSMMHSKRHLLSNYLDFIDKKHDVKDNTNLYIMEETRDAHMPIIEDASGTHVFSGYILSCFEEIQVLADAQVAYVRIDGLFHDIAYVISMLQLYHQVLNQEISAKEASKLCTQIDPEGCYEKGFLYTKTSKQKQEGA